AGTIYTQFSDGQQPLLVPEVFGDKPGIFFDGNDFLRNDTQNPGGSSGVLVALIRPTESVSGTRSIFAESSLSISNLHVRATINDGNLAYGTRNGATVNTARSNTTVLQPDQDYIVVWRSNGSSWSFQVNEINQSVTTSSGTNTGAWYGFTSGPATSIGATLLTGNPTDYFTGYIGGMFLTTSNITDQQLGKLVQHFIDWQTSPDPEPTPIPDPIDPLTLNPFFFFTADNGIVEDEGLVT